MLEDNKIDDNSLENSSFIRSGILGIFIGLAIIIPGLSGAQITIIFKLYDKLMYALSHIFRKRSILFLLPILIGAIVGFVGGFFSIQYLLNISTIAIVFLFAGMMLGGMPSVIDEVKGQKFKNIYFLNAIIGLCLPVLMSALAIYFELDMSSLLQDPPLYFYFFMVFVGVLLSLTQLIPGLSATSLLLSLGLYTALLESVSLDNLLNNTSIFIFYLLIVVGAIIGILTISKFINKCLNKYRVGFYYLIIGLCLGSLFVMFYNPEMYQIFIDKPDTFYIELGVGIGLFVVGLALIYFIYRYTKTKERRD